MTPSRTQQCGIALLLAPLFALLVLTSCDPGGESSKSDLSPAEELLVLSEKAEAFVDNERYELAALTLGQAVKLVGAPSEANAISLVDLLVREGDAFQKAGRSSEALAAFERSATVAGSHLAPESDQLVGIDARLGLARIEAGQIEPGIASLEAARERLLAKQNEASLLKWYFKIANTLAGAYEDLERDDEAEAIVLERASFSREWLGPEKLETGISCSSAAKLFEDRLNFLRAEDFCLAAIVAFEATLDADDQRLGTEFARLSRLRVDDPVLQESTLEHASRALSIFRSSVTDNEVLRDALTLVARLAVRTGRVAEHTDVFRQGAELSVKIDGENSPARILSEALLAHATLAAGRTEEATAIFNELAGRRDEDETFKSIEYSDAFDYVALGLARTGSAQAGHLILADNADRSQDLGDAHPRFLRSCQRLNDLYLELGNYNEADPLTAHLLAAVELRYTAAHHRPGHALLQLGEIDRALLRLPEAEEHYRRALEILLTDPGGESPWTARARDGLARTILELARFDEAVTLLRKNLEVRRSLDALHEDTFVTEGMLVLALLSKGQVSEAETIGMEALERADQMPAANNLGRAALLEGLGLISIANGEIDDAVNLTKEALEIRVKLLGDRHADTIHAKTSAAIALMEAGDPGNAEFLFDDALKSQRLPPGSGSAETARISAGLGKLYDQTGHAEPAEKFHGQAVMLCEQLYGPDHILMVGTLRDAGVSFRSRDNHDHAEELFVRAMEAAEKHHGPDSAEVLLLMNLRAENLAAAGKPEESEPLTGQARDLLEKLERDSPETAIRARLDLSKVYLTMGNHEMAEAELTHAAALVKGFEISAGPAVLRALGQAALRQYSQNRLERAAALFEKAIAVCEADFPGRAEFRAKAWKNLGTVRLNSGDFEGAREPFDRALSYARHDLGEESPEAMEALHLSGLCARQLGKTGEAIETLTKAYRLSEKIRGRDHPDTDSYRFVLASASAAANDHVFAAQLFDQCVRYRLEHFGKENSSTINAQSMLADTFHNLSQYPKAIAIHVKMIDALLKMEGENSLNVAFVYRKAGDAYYRMSNRSKALEYYEAAARTFRKTGAPGKAPLLSVEKTIRQLTGGR